jgi:hypothetical protein
MIKFALAAVLTTIAISLTILTIALKVVWNHSLHTTFPEAVPTISISQAFGYAALIYTIIFICQFKITFNAR